MHGAIVRGKPDEVAIFDPRPCPLPPQVITGSLFKAQQKGSYKLQRTQIYAMHKLYTNIRIILRNTKYLIYIYTIYVYDMIYFLCHFLSYLLYNTSSSISFYGSFSSSSSLSSSLGKAKVAKVNFFNSPVSL